ncbi:MAG: hypothetical protein AAFZ18_12385 [Myxococcota bacterium]
MKKKMALLTPFIAFAALAASTAEARPRSVGRAYHPADVNLDGVVTRAEQRRVTRARAYHVADRNRDGRVSSVEARIYRDRRRVVRAAVTPRAVRRSVVVAPRPRPVVVKKVVVHKRGKRTKKVVVRRTVRR